MITFFSLGIVMNRSSKLLYIAGLALLVRIDFMSGGIGEGIKKDWTIAVDTTSNFFKKPIDSLSRVPGYYIAHRRPMVVAVVTYCALSYAWHHGASWYKKAVRYWAKRQLEK